MKRLDRMRQPLAAVACMLAVSMNAPSAAAADEVAGETYLPAGHVLKLNFFNIEKADARVTFRFVAPGTTRVVCELPIAEAVRQGRGVSATTSDCENAVAFEGKRVTGVVSAAFEVPLFLKSMELFGPADLSGERDRIWGTNGTSIVNFVMRKNDPDVRMRVQGAQGASPGQMIFLAPVTSDKAGGLTVTVSNMVNAKSVMAVASIYNGATGELEQSTWQSPFCGKLVECLDPKTGYALRSGRDATASLALSKSTGMVVGVATVLFDDPIIAFDDPIIAISSQMVGGSPCSGAGAGLFTMTTAVKGANAPVRSTTLLPLREK